MIQLTVLTGKKAGTEWVARGFPVRIGRHEGNDLVLDDDGVWDRHFDLDLQRYTGVHLTAQPEALTAVNGERVQEILLRNGDRIELGSVQVRFDLAPTRQRSLRFREAATWVTFGLLCLGQIGLMYSLLE